LNISVISEDQFDEEKKEDGGEENYELKDDADDEDEEASVQSYHLYFHQSLIIAVLCSLPVGSLLTYSPSTGSFYNFNPMVFSSHYDIHLISTPRDVMKPFHH
jgi:hypothetical protein